MGEITKEDAIKIYEIANKQVNKLAKIYSISKKDLVKHYYQPSYNLATITEDEIFMRFAQSLQNSGRMSNSIKFDVNHEIIEKIVSNLRKGKYVIVDEVYNAFNITGIVGKSTAVKEKTNWWKYSKGLLSFNTFYDKYNLQKTFEDLADERFDETITLAKKIAKNVFSMGFTLACDFLKECGCTWLAKPDTHILEISGVIFNEQYMQIDNYKYKAKDLENCVRKMHALVDNINQKYKNVTDYQLDKIFWLISTHNFYKHPKNLINRDTLCEKIQEIMSTK